MPNHNAAEVAPMRGVRIEDNRIVHPRRGAMVFHNLGHSTIRDNIITGLGGIKTNHCGPLVICGNTVNGEPL